MSETPDPGAQQPDPARPPGEDSTPAGQAPVPPPGGEPGPSEGYASGQGDPYGQPWAPAGQGFPAPGSGLDDQLPDDGPAPVLVSFAPVAKQNRLTVLFRALLAIPAVIVLFFLLIAAYVVGFIGWWAALFTGRLPGWAFEFLTGFVRWGTRVQAYGALLTDRYPPFRLDDDPDYPVRLFSKQTRLNRAAVFFRIILVIPADIVAGVAFIGMTILSIGGWLIALFTGKLPDSMHAAFTAIVRYYARFTGYFFMITPEYPAGLYGDQVSAPAAPAQDWAAATTPTETAPVTGETAPVTGETAPVTGETAPVTGVVAAAASPWQLTLSGSARILVTVAIVLGALGDVANATYVTFRSTTAVSRAQADQTVTHDYNKLGSVLSTFQTKTESCQQSLPCVTKLDRQVADAFKTFGDGLGGAGVPSDFSADTAALTADNTKIVNDFNQLGAATSASQYTSIAGTLSLQADLTSWQSAFDKLHNELHQP